MSASKLSTATEPADIAAGLTALHKYACSGKSDPSRFEADVAALRTQFDISVAIAARKLNSMVSLQSRLPDELWCMAWQDLPLADRLSVTRACHAWRTLAVGCPRVWSLIDFYSEVHGSDCTCPECGDLDILVRSGLVVRPPERTNFRLLDFALKRSGEAPLILHIADLLPLSNDDIYVELSTKLQPYAARIVAIRMDLGDCYRVLPLLDRIHTGALPALRVLAISCVTCKDDDDYYAHRNFISKVFRNDIALKSLEELRLPWCAYPARSWTSFRLPALQTISLTVSDADDILPLLLACPSLDVLHLTFAEDFDVGDDLSVPAHQAKILRLVRRLSDVCLTSVPEEFENVTLSSFAAPEVPLLSIGHKYEDSAYRTLQALVSHFDATEGVTLSVTTINAGLDTVIGLTTRNGRRHEVCIAGTDSITSNTWTHIPGPLPTSVVLDANLWSQQVRFKQLPRPMPNVTSVTFVNSQIWAWEYVDSVTHRALDALLFPALETVHLKGRRSDRAIASHKVVVILDVLRSPARGGPPVALYTHGIRIEGDMTELASRATVHRLDG
ncbi:hypothetical protein EXIGLDRAFT_830477, partial [Exidia glandulosa HHB12029]